MTSHDPITPAARELFDRASSRLDQDAASRLRRARREALEAPASRSRATMMVPAGAFAAAVLALGLAWWMPPGQGLPANGQDDLAGTEIDALMVDEDAELYAWLADAPVATGAGSPQ